jgi:hypothetical protein
MPKGNDLLCEVMTLDEARAYCLSRDECAGFTYQSEDPAPQGKLTIWFKSSDKIAPGAGWHSCLKSERPPARAPAHSTLHLCLLWPPLLLLASPHTCPPARTTQS